VQPLAPVVALALLYAVVLAQHGRDATVRLTPVRVLAGVGGLVALALALGPPLDGWAASDLAAHMLQHVVLLAVAPPLLLLGCVPAVVVCALPPASRQRLERAAGRIARTMRAAPPLYRLARSRCGRSCSGCGTCHGSRRRGYQPAPARTRVVLGRLRLLVVCAQARGQRAPHGHRPLSRRCRHAARR
jgi:hypothetical protein